MSDDKLKFIAKAAFETAAKIIEKMQESGDILFGICEEPENSDDRFQFYATTLEHIVTDFVMGYAHPLASFNDFFDELKQRVLVNVESVTDCECEH